MRNDLFKVLFGALLTLIVIGSLKGCGNSDDGIISSEVEIVTVHDTTFIKGQSDTLFIKGERVVIYRDVPTEVEVINDSVKEYRYDINNTDLVGVINTQSTGNVKYSKLEYRVICPVITKVDTFRITRQDSIKTTVVVNKLFNLSVGANLFSVGDPTAGVYLSYNYKKNINVGIGVERSATNTIYGLSARYTLLRW